MLQTWTLIDANGRAGKHTHTACRDHGAEDVKENGDVLLAFTATFASPLGEARMDHASAPKSMTHAVTHSWTGQTDSAVARLDRRYSAGTHLCAWTKADDGASEPTFLLATRGRHEIMWLLEDGTVIFQRTTGFSSALGKLSYLFAVLTPECITSYSYSSVP